MSIIIVLDHTHSLDIDSTLNIQHLLAVHTLNVVQVATRFGLSARVFEPP